MNHVIIGLGFGDCGKGMFTDYLCSHLKNSLVIRYSGGHQAGHTVVTDKVSHVFSNFGSGTLRDKPTYWSKFCTVDPVGIVNELKCLKEDKIKPTLYIDERCPITTPYDKYYNCVLEKKFKHGSCGVGFGSTIEREENHYSLTFLDLFYPNILEEKLRNIIKYYVNKSDSNLVKMGLVDYSLFILSCKEIIKSDCIHKVYDYLKNKRKINDIVNDHYYEHCIFEGSQGLMLDKNIGFFPNVTRSNTGMTNVMNLMNSNNNYAIYLITRAYQTRHGNGYMTNEDIPHKISINSKETNVLNQYQGEFRRSILDVSLLEYAIQKDTYTRKADNKNLVITCLDHVKKDLRFTYKGEIIKCSNEKEFIGKISQILGISNVYLSRTNNSKNIKKF